MVLSFFEPADIFFLAQDRLAVRNLFELLGVLGMQSAHDAIPDVEVEAKVPVEVAVVHVVVGGGVVPINQFVAGKSFWKQLEAEMTQSIERYLVNTKSEQGSHMHRQRKKQDRPYHSLYKSFDRMK